jgi:hypothetical protein
MLMSNPMIPRDGLLVEMLFDDDAQDTSGLGNNPSVLRNNTYDPSRFGKSVELGIDSYVQLASSSGFNLSTIRNATIAFWIRRTSSGTILTYPGSQLTVL